MIKNYYYLTVGILSLLFSFTHAWFGQSTVISTIDMSNIDLATKTAVFYTWHMSTIENAIFGIAFLFMALSRDLPKLRFTVWLIASIVVARYLVFLGSTLFKNISGIDDALTELAVVIVYVGLMLLGTRIKGEIPSQVRTTS